MVEQDLVMLEEEEVALQLHLEEVVHLEAS